jgi:hypothetical protein
VSDPHSPSGVSGISTGLLSLMFRLPCFPFWDGDTGIGRVSPAVWRCRGNHGPSLRSG